MSSQCDYPAAHSMDTVWFAIDDDGNVAVFDSGEAGAVPDEAYLGDDYGDLLELCAELPVTEVLQAHHPGLLVNRPVHAAAMGYPMLVFLASPEAVADLIDAKVARPVPAHGEAAVSLVYTEELYARLHDAQLCRHCRYWDGDEDDRDDDDVRAERHGLYRFAHASDNIIAGPYERISLPSTPVRVDALPADMREKMVRFEGRFAETTALQPVEHWPSHAWGATWVASDGQTVHALPGREGEFEKEREMVGDLDGLVWKPPGASAKARRPWWKIW